MLNVDLDFDRYPTMLRFNASTAYIRAVIGPAGSGKTTYAFKELLIRSILQEPNAKNVRPTKWYVVRNTYKQLRDNTMGSFQLAIGGLAEVAVIRENPTPKAKLRFQLGDKTWVDTQFIFVAMENPDAVADMLGAEMTGILVDEASEIKLHVIEACQKRIGRYPSMADVPPSWIGMIMTTNGPKKNHWLYSWHTKPPAIWADMEEQMGRPFFELFQQPPAMIRPTKPGEKWLPNPLAENVHNLDPSYYIKMLGDSDDSIKAYVEGKFSDLKTGKIVWPEFDFGLHKVDEAEISVPVGAPIMMSFDFGRTPVCLVAICTESGRLVVTDEIVGENMSIDTLYTGDIKPTVRTRYPKSKVINAWGDPAGNDETQAVDLSPFQVLQAYGIPIEIPWDTRNKMTPRLEAVRRRLTTLGRDGRPLLGISSRCVLLLAAITEGYIYEAVKGAKDDDVVRDTPTKTHIGWASDLADALQYLCLGFDAHYSTKKKDDRVKNHRSRGSLMGRRG